MVEPRKLFNTEVKVVNVGLRIFYEDLKKQGVKVVHVNYQPRPKLEKELESKLSELL
ncbi:MAG: hypothetical protein LM585_00085 [Fervidicoccaceae archaeon]|jgi:deoxyribodipyrimidine photolyase-like uncharacterized protein|nr:hypothetical protein [Fervidicoccaceae archaeon]MCC6051624.1 hypothetical protein [Fervidicoccaceae archaeon]NAZ11563.1 fdrA domain protein [Desulfurococcales archaeon]